MIVSFEKSFIKDISKLTDKSLKKKLAGVIETLEAADSLNSIKNLKKLTGYKSYYRIRISDYRLGLELKDDGSLLLIAIAHRKDIYNNFPKD
jgi:mRNA interferase RelE/StbE